MSRMAGPDHSRVPHRARECGGPCLRGRTRSSTGCRRPVAATKTPSPRSTTQCRAGSIYGLVLRVVQTLAQADEVTQEVFLDIWRQSARFDPQRGSALSWMLTIAHRRAVDRCGPRRPPPERDSALVAENQDTPHDSTAERAERSPGCATVRNALDAPTDTQRGAVELAYFGGYTQHRRSPASSISPARQDADPGRAHPTTRLFGRCEMSADIHSLSGAYAVDAVDGDERVLFEEHLAPVPRVPRRGRQSARGGERAHQTSPVPRPDPTCDAPCSTRSAPSGRCRRSSSVPRTTPRPSTEAYRPRR